MELDNPPRGWWQTAPGILTAVAATLTAIAGLIVAIHQIRTPSTTTEQKAIAVCAETFKTLQAWGTVGATVVSVNVNGTASYSRIPVRFSGASVPLLSGVASQYLSDRFDAVGQPFDRTRVDQLELQVMRSERVDVVFSLRSWNNARITLTPDCTNEFMYGYSNDGQTYYAIHFDKR